MTSSSSTVVSGIPAVNISLTTPSDESFSFKEPADIPITSCHVLPADYKINPMVLGIIKSLSKDIAFHLGREFSKPFQFRISLSQEQGAEIDNPRIADIFKKVQTGVGVAVDVKSAKNLGMMHVKQADLSDGEKVEALQKYQSPLVFFDLISSTLFQARQREPLQLEMVVSPFFPSTQGGGLTAAAFRFPHMYIDMLNKYDYRRLTENLDICLIGPRLCIPENSAAYCPQLAELMAIFPKGNFTVLDNNSKTVNILKGQIESLNVVSYDPLVFRMLTMDVPNNSRKAPESFQPGLQLMADTWAVQTKLPLNSKQMLNGHGKIQYMMLNADPKKIAVKPFDISTSTLAREEKFDVMIATMSMLQAFSEGKGDIQQLFPGYLAALNSQGELYIDSPLLTDLLMPAYHCKTAEELVQKLSEQLGTRFSLRRLGIESYLSGHSGDVATLPTIAIASSKKEDAGIHAITTCSLYVFTHEG